MRHVFAGLLACASLAACAQAEPPAKAGAMAPIADAEPDVAQQVSEILGRIGQGTIAPDQLTENARAALSAADMQAMIVALRPCGAAPALELLRRTTKGEDRQYLYRVPCGGNAQLVEIVFGKGARVNRLLVKPEQPR
jgi:hypothetical protein